MNRKDEIMMAIVDYMKSIELTDVKHSVTKVNIVLKVAQKLNIPESQEYSVIEEFDELYKIDMIRSSYRTYDEKGVVSTTISTDDEKFYLKH
ncbi:MAG: hypothetical protein P4L59_12475 [Desulfosporosinus sp.]|nr:hypothetical protein [Desulfosporosinus sp.]